MSNTWTLSLILGAMSFVAEACELPGRLTRYDLMGDNGVTNLTGASTQTGIEKFREDWNLPTGLEGIYVSEWD